MRSLRRLRACVLGALAMAIAASLALVAVGLGAQSTDTPDLTGYFPPGNGLTVNAFVDTYTAPGKVLYRFDSVILNAPTAGALDLYKPAGSTTADQVIWAGGLPPTTPVGQSDVPTGTIRDTGGDFAYSALEGHNHWHFPFAAEYRLLTSGGTLVKDAAKNTAGFCLTDSWDVPGYAAYFPDGSYCRPFQPDYTGVIREGISPGKGDQYWAGLADQWVEVQGVQPGTDYRLYVKVNPQGLIQESNTANNVSETTPTIIVPGGQANPTSASTPAGQAVAITLPGAVIGANVRSRVSATCDMSQASCFTTATPGALTYAVAAAPPASQGTVSISGSKATFTPAAGFSGQSTFTYTATDSRGLSGPPATVTVTVGGSTQASVNVTPATASVQTGATQQFTATVTGSTATPVWSVNGVTGGNSTVGTVSASGLYTAPASVPSGGTVTVAASAGGASDSSTVTITAPTQATVDVTPATASVQTGATRQFTATVTGTTDTPAWSVNGVAGGNATVGTVSASGLYTAPAAVPSGGSVTVTASAGGASDSATVTITAVGTGTRDPNGLPAYDAVTGADQGPPIDSLFTGPLWSGQKVWKRISNQAGPSASGWNDTYTTATTARPVGIPMQDTSPPPSGSIMFVWLPASGLGSSPTGYALRVARGAGSGGSDDIQVQRWNGGGATWLAGRDGITLKAGDWLALMADASGVEGFYSTDGSTWTSLGSKADTSIAGPFRGGMETNAQTTRVDNVGFGASAG
jgi:hypothetical protein